ncbi:hypothetical protein [uncultured Clostridium sp.]|uniref:hypothetical protein n=1 Tax=uncultured Clostridium sp. TaxID=59620 RepID=UPI002600B12C|nr:hypothetical protein [uncultured Clostridium sp.]
MDEIINNIAVFNNVSELSTANLNEGTKAETLGYNEAFDNGGCQYYISKDINPWSISLKNGLYANVIKKDYVNYKMFGCNLDGIKDDTEGINKAHLYCNENKVLLKNNFGTIYKSNNSIIKVKYDVDLSGSIILVTNDNAYSWYQIVNDNETIYSYEDSVNKSELKKDASNITMNDNSLPSDSVIIIKDLNPWATRNDDGDLYKEYRSELMFHHHFGYCSGPLIYGYDDEKTNLYFKYMKYNNKKLVFIGCKIRIETTPNVTVNVIDCRRHNTILKDFYIDPKNNSLKAKQYKNSVIYVQDSFNIKIENVIGTNIAGYPGYRGSSGSGYTLCFRNCYKITMDNCHISGFWGCMGTNCIKEMTITNCSLNRIDVHNYFSNIYIENTTLYDWGINVGCGNGLLSISNCKFVNYTSPNFGGQTLVNINNSYGYLFDGTVVIKDSEVIKDNLNISIMKIDYISKTGEPRAKVKIPSLIVENLKVRNISKNNSNFIVYSFTGDSDYVETVSTKIEKPDIISINNLSYTNDDTTKGNLIFIKDEFNKDIYTNTVTPKISLSQISFSSDFINDQLISNGKDIDLFTATKNAIQLDTTKKLCENSSISLDDVSLVLYHGSDKAKLTINNSIIYGYSTNNKIDSKEITTFLNSEVRIFPYNFESGGYEIPCGKYINTVFKDYVVSNQESKAFLSYDTTLIGTNKDNLKYLPKTISSHNNILELGKSRIQVANIETSTLIKLPSVNDYTEISLIFSTSKYVNVMIPSCKMNNKLSYSANKTFRLDFTFINNSIGWIGEAKVYG